MFIGSGDFTQGDDAHPPAIPKALAYGTSTFTGAVVFANISRRLAQSLLPDGLFLDAGTNPLHPVLHLAGLQDNVGVADDQGNTAYGYMPYREFILAVPFVRVPFSTQWHNFVVHMYLESDIAQVLGDFFAYRKTIGFVKLDPTGIASVRVDNALGDTVFVGTYTDDPAAFSGSDAQADVSLANYKEMKKIIRMPMLGVDPATSVLVFSRFEWDVTGASVDELTWGSIKYKAEFDPPDLAGVPLASTPGGAVALTNVKWKLSTPPLYCDASGNVL